MSVGPAGRSVVGAQTPTKGGGAPAHQPQGEERPSLSLTG